MVEAVATSRRWRNPGLARFLSDFLTQIVKEDTELLRAYENELDVMEDAIMSDVAEGISQRINEMRGELRDLDDHYNHLMDLLVVLEENENGFFQKKDLAGKRLWSLQKKKSFQIF